MCVCTFIWVFIILILLIPIRIEASYCGKFKFDICYLIWKKETYHSLEKDKNGNDLSINPGALHPKIKKHFRKTRKKKLTSKLTIRKTSLILKNFSDFFVKLLKRYLKLAQILLKLGLKWNLKLDLKLFVCDAAKTGILFGFICSFLSLFPPQKCMLVAVAPNFEEQKTSSNFNLRVLVFPLGFLVGAILVLGALLYDFVRFMRLKKKVKV